MDHNNIIKNVIARSVPGTFSSNAQRVFMLADKYTSAQIRGYLFQVYNYNVKAKMDLNYPLTLQTDAQGLSIPELVRAAYAARDEQIVTTVTTFNVSKVLQEQGYNQEVHQKIDSEDLGATLPIGVDKTPFPKDNVRGYMKFTSSADFFYLPIHGQFINTNFFRKKDIVKPIFIGPLIETAFLFASFSSLVNGKVVKVQVGDAGSKLLGFEEMLGKKYSMGMDVIAANLESWLASISAPSGKKWENTTLHGDEWAHTIYQIFVKQSHDDDFLPTLVDAVSTFVQIQEEDGTTSSMLSFDDQGDLVIQSVPLVLCMQLRGMQLNIEKRIVTLHQAYAALDLARLVRGHDKSKKGTLSRVALFGCNIEPGLAEISYMATNISRFIGKGDIILFVDEGKTSGQIINFLQALVILEYKGRVFLKVTPSIIGSLSPSPNIVTDVIDNLYRFGVGEFDIVGCSPINLVTKTWYYDQQDVLLPDRPYIFDLRTFATTGNSPDLLEASVKREFVSRYAEWSHWIYPVVSRAKIFTGIYAFDNLICCTGVELHNLVVWTLHSKPDVTGYKLMPVAQYKKSSDDGTLVTTMKYLLYEDDSWYYILDDKSLSEVLAASVLTNIARCNRPFIRCSPTTVLKFYDFRFPILIKKGLGKIGVSATSFKIIKILEERNATPKDVLEAFRKSDTVSKAAIMSHPQYGQLLNHALNEGTSQSSVVTEGTTVSSVKQRKKLLMVDDGSV